MEKMEKNGKMDQLSFIINELQIDILGISETKLNSTVNDHELHIRKDRVTDRGGGIAIYIRSNISFSFCPNLQDNNIETIWINVQLTKSLKFLLCMFYRPPSARVSYRETFIVIVIRPLLLTLTLWLLGTSTVICLILLKMKLKIG